MSEQDPDYIPMPIVHIDQDSDPEATIVQLSFGDRLGALIDTVNYILSTRSIEKNVALLIYISVAANISWQHVHFLFTCFISIAVW